MKKLNFNWLFTALASTVFLFSACKKTENDPQLGDNGQQLIQFLKYGGPASVGFANSNLLFNPTSTEERLELNLSYSTSQVTDKDITVTVAYDPEALAAFNANLPVDKRYQKLPDSTYSFPATTVLIKAGQTVSEPFYVTFYPNKIDGSINYMLPLKITGISGAPANVKAAAGTGTAYFHFIGNPLAGLYSVVGTRYNYSGVINYNGGPIPTNYISTATSPSPKTLAPVDFKTTKTFYANLGAGTDRDYIFTYDASVSLTNIDVTFTPSFLAGISNVRILTHTYDPATKKITILSTYNNQPGGVGDDRIVSEVFTKL